MISRLLLQTFLKHLHNRPPQRQYQSHLKIWEGGQKERKEIQGVPSHITPKTTRSRNRSEREKIQRKISAIFVTTGGGCDLNGKKCLKVVTLKLMRQKRSNDMKVHAGMKRKLKRQVDA